MDSRKRVLRHILKSYHGKDVLQRCSEPDFVYEDAEAEDHVRQHDHDEEYDDFDSNGLDELEKHINTAGEVAGEDEETAARDVDLNNRIEIVENAIEVIGEARGAKRQSAANIVPSK